MNSKLGRQSRASMYANSILNAEILMMQMFPSPFRFPTQPPPPLSLRLIGVSPPSIPCRARFDSIVVGGKVYVVGGSDGSTELHSVEVFDVEVGTTVQGY